VSWMRSAGNTPDIDIVTFPEGYLCRRNSETGKELLLVQE